MTYYETVKMAIREGSCLSVLGTISYNSETGMVEMNNLLAVLAGGISEAKRFLKTEIAISKYYLFGTATLASLFFFASATMAFFSYSKYSQLK